MVSFTFYIKQECRKIGERSNRSFKYVEFGGERVYRRY